MVEAWEIRGWSLKVQEEPLSTGSSQNESCYLILLSTLLRFIRQLFDALQYATNRARIVCRRRSLFSALDIPSCRHSPSLPPVASAFFMAYIHQTTCTRVYIFSCLHNLATFSRSVTFSNFLLATFLQILLPQPVFTDKILTTMIVLRTLSRNYINFNVQVILKHGLTN